MTCAFFFPYLGLWISSVNNYASPVRLKRITGQRQEVLNKLPMSFVAQPTVIKKNKISPS